MIRSAGVVARRRLIYAAVMASGLPVASAISLGSTLTYYGSWDLTPQTVTDRSYYDQYHDAESDIDFPYFDPARGTLTAVDTVADGNGYADLQFFGGGGEYIAQAQINRYGAATSWTGDMWFSFVPIFNDPLPESSTPYDFPSPLPTHAESHQQASQESLAGWYSTINTVTVTTKVAQDLTYGAFTDPVGNAHYSGMVYLTYTYTPTSGGGLTFGGSSQYGETYVHDSSTLTISGDLIIGDAGSATFSQGAGLVSVSGSTILGNQSIGNGTYNLSSSGVLTTANDLIVGNYGTGTLNQTGGTNTVSGTLRIAKQPGSTGTYNLSGGVLTAPSVVNNGAFNFTGGSASISTLTGTGSTTVASGQNLNLSLLQQGSLTANGAVSVAANGDAAHTVRLNTLSIGSSGKLDLNDNDLVVNSGNCTALQALVFAGYRQSADPTATGIISTTGQTAAYNPVLQLLDNSLPEVSSSDYPFGSGLTISANAVIGKYTYIGSTLISAIRTGMDKWAPMTTALSMPILGTQASPRASLGSQAI